jgi:hypothetical protein
MASNVVRHVIKKVNIVGLIEIIQRNNIFKKNLKGFK